MSKQEVYRLLTLIYAHASYEGKFLPNRIYSKAFLPLRSTFPQLFETRSRAIDSSEHRAHFHVREDARTRRDQ